MKRKSTKTTVTFRLDKAWKRLILQQARQVQMTPSAYVEKIVSETVYLKYIDREQAND